MDAMAAVRDALLGLQSAFDDASRRRVGVARRLGGLDIAGAEAATVQALVAAMLRRVAADRDEAATLADRAKRVADEVRAAAHARSALGDVPEIERLLGEYDAAWVAALDASARLAAGLRGKAPEPVTDAFAGYVAALHAVHDVDPTDAAALDAAIAALTSAGAELERAVATMAG